MLKTSVDEDLWISVQDDCVYGCIWFCISMEMRMKYRLVRESDASAYLEFFRYVVSETDNLACSAEEAAAMTVEDEQVFIRNTNGSGSFSIIAASDDGICGSCDIRIQNRERLRHRAEMGIAVRREYWGTGVAQHLLEEAIAEAKTRRIRIISLTVRSDNKRAVAFYKRNGFELSGVLRMLFCIDGKYYDGEQYELLLK